MDYTISLEDYNDTLQELMPMYRRAYEEMLGFIPEGLKRQGFDPWIEAYTLSNVEKTLLLFVVRKEGVAVGYCLMFITRDLKDNTLMAYEDYIYLEPGHRNGLGKYLAKFIIAELNARGIKRITVSVLKGTGLELVWSRLGFKVVATQMELSL